MLDSGEVIRNFIELLDPAKVEVARVVPWEVSVHRESPAVFVQALYLVPTAGGKAAGLLKIALHADRARPIACLHDEVGYVRTFERLAKALFDSFESKSAAPKPEYTDTVILRLDKIPVGFESTICSRTERPAAMVLPARPPSCRVTRMLPHRGIEASNVSSILRGGVKESVWMETSGGEERTPFELSQKKNSSTRTRERYEGKKIQGTFAPAAKAWLASPVATASALARLLRRKAPST